MANFAGTGERLSALVKAAEKLTNLRAQPRGRRRSFEQMVDGFTIDVAARYSQD